MSKPEASENREHSERRSDEPMLVLVQGIQYDVHNLQRDVEAMRTDLANHISTEPNDWAKALSMLMADAFPEGDAEGHRKIHEANIKAAEDKAAFWSKMTYELKKWGLIGFTLWAICALRSTRR